MAALVDLENLGAEEAGAKWLAENEAVWKRWTK
jgi:ABC-type proline/glycine betaine transport system substrate-binding protein